jgi:hypothetical protein
MATAEQSKPEIDNFCDIVALCDDQSIRLHDEIEHSVDASIKSQAYCHTPEDILLAVAQSGKLLRKCPSLNLANGMIVIPDTSSLSVPAKTFIEIVNASLVPLQKISSARSIPFFEAENCCSLDTCKYAETSFGNIISSVLAQKARSGTGYQTFRTQRGRPLFVRKGSGEPSALTLVDIVINGIPYPAGSLVRIDHFMDKKKRILDRAPLNGIEDLTVTGIDRIAFLRLSAFALDSLRRRVMTNGYTDFKPWQQVELQDMTIDKLRRSLVYKKLRAL